MYKKEIAKYNGSFCVMVPIYYEFEAAPSWRKYFIGSKSECESVFSSAPDYLFATYEENKRSREWKMKEYLFLLEIGKKERAASIRLQYGF